MSERDRPELLAGRILLFTAFLLEWFFWRLAVGPKANALYAATFAMAALPVSAALHWPPVYLYCSMFVIVLLLRPSHLLRSRFESRMRFWSFYDYGLALAEVARLRAKRS